MSSDAASDQHGVHLTQIGQIAITVSDLSRSKAFYQHILGINFLFNAGNMAFFQCGAIRIMLGTNETAKSLLPSSTILYFKVDDLEGTYARLAALGVSFLQPPHLVAKMPDHNLWMAFLTDPDNNPIGLMSEVPHAAS